MADKPDTETPRRPEDAHASSPKPDTHEPSAPEIAEVLPRPDTHQPSGPEMAEILDEDAVYDELAKEESTLPPDSAIDLGAGKTPGSSRRTPGSGDPESSPWTALVDVPASSKVEPVKIDSPSDADVLRRAGAATEVSGEADAIGGEVLPRQEGTSRVDLSEPPPQGDPLASDVYPRYPEDEEAVDLGSAPPKPEQGSVIDVGSSSVLLGDDSGVQEVSAQSSSGLDLGSASAAPIKVTTDSADAVGRASQLEPGSGMDIGSPSGVGFFEDFAAAEMGDEEASPRVPQDEESATVQEFLDPAQLAALTNRVPGSSVTRQPPEVQTAETAHLQDPNQPLEEDSEAGFLLVDDDSFDTASGVDLGAGSAPRPGDSGRDLIAEAVESGVDLLGGSRPNLDESEEDVVLTGAEPMADSSSVDLGAMATQDFNINDLGSGAADLEVETVEDEEAAEEVVEAFDDDEPETMIGKVPNLDGSDKFEPAGAGLLELAGGTAGKVDLGRPAVEDSAEGTLEDVLYEEEAAAVLSGQDDELRATRPESRSVLRGAIGEEEADEEEVAVMEDEPETATEKPAAALEKEDEQPYVPPPRPKYGRRWLGGTLVGATMAGAACVGLWVFGVEPPKSWREAVSETPTKPKPGPGGQTNAVNTGGQPGAVSLASRFDSGDFSGEPGAIDENNGEELAQRGAFVWLQYYKNIKDPKDIKLDSAEVKKALEDLKAAEKLKAPHGTLWQGHMQESVGNLDEALKIYQEGAKAFEANKEKKQLFDDAIERVQVQKTLKPMGQPGAQLPTRLPALLPVLVRAAAQDPPAAPPPEAGPDFWKAVNLAGAGKYADAIKSLEEAQDKHLARKRTRLFKAQNPNSDPDEKIFEVTCKKLIDLFKAQDEFQKKLIAADFKMLADQKDFVKGLEGVLADRKKLKDDYATLMESSKTATTAIKKLTEERDQLKTDKTTLETKVTTLEGKNTSLTTDLKSKQKDLDNETDKVRELTMQRTTLSTTVKEVGSKLKLDNVEPLRDREIILKALNDKIDLANVTDRDGKISELQRKSATLESDLAKRRTPEELLSYWLQLLRDRTQTALVKSALEDVQRVKNAQASGEQKALALAVEGLAHRNTQDFAKARESLSLALTTDAGQGAWRTTAGEVFKELSDPTAYYLPRAEELRNARRYPEALALLEVGLKVFADNKGELLALRSLTRLEAALKANKERVTENTAGIKEANDDAQAAIKDGAVGSGNYAAGRIAEELGQMTEAADFYRKAVATKPATDPDGARWRLALGRVLIGQPNEAPMRREGKLDEAFKKYQALARKIESGQPPSREELTLLVTLVQPPMDEAKRREAEALAREILDLPDINERPLLRARAHALRGLWGEALKDYTEGLLPLLSKEDGQWLRYIVANTPNLVNRIDTTRTPHPAQAEKHYATGLDAYFAKNYGIAEEQFKMATQNFAQDARFWYFLGLSRMMQKKPYREDMLRAANLEDDNRPSRDAVNAALERIQGRPRDAVLEARGEPRPK